MKTLKSLFVICIIASTISAQPFGLNFNIQSYPVSSGVYQGQSEIYLAYSHNIINSGSPWMQVIFSDANFGTSSYVKLTSNKDNTIQKLNSISLNQWQNYSAYFNGDSLLVELYVAPGDNGIYFEIDEIKLGVSNTPIEDNGICDNFDNRLLSYDPAVGRILKQSLDANGTAWINKDGRLVTAGHCVNSLGEATIVEFNVPLSLPDGTIQHPEPEHQYSIDLQSIIYSYTIIGDDWGVFEVFPNPNTGLLPKEAQNAYLLPIKNHGASHLRVTGYGRDDGIHNRVQQSCTGYDNGSSGITIQHRVDATLGNSGSPIIDEGTGNVIGIHNTSGCETGPNESNYGTSNYNTGLMNELNIGNVLVDQKLENGTSVGIVGHWENNTFNTYSAPEVFDFQVGNYEALRGEDEIISYEKFYSWNIFDFLPENFLIHKTFGIQSQDNNFISGFIRAYGNVIIKNKLTSAPGEDGGIINFKDPWFIDYPDPLYGDTKRNRGMDDIGDDSLKFHERSSPFYPDFTTQYDGNKYLGVLLDQRFDIPGNPFYSIRVPQSQEIPVNGKTIDYIFQNWEGEEVQFEDAASPTTALVFRDNVPGVAPEARAVYKGHLASSGTDDYSTNSQRKLVRTDDGRYHTVYSENDAIWICSSAGTDFNGLWENDVLLLEYENTQWKNPAIDVYENEIILVCEVLHFGQNGYIDAYSYNTQTKELSPITGIGGSFEPDYFGLAKPVVACDPDKIWVLYRSDEQSGIKFSHLGGSGTLPNSDEQSVNPTIAFGKSNGTLTNDVYIAWQQGISSIKYISYVYSSGIFTDYSDISTGSGFTRNQFPSISAAAKYYPIVSWTGSFKNIQESILAKPTDVSMWQHRAVVRSKSRTIWQNFYNTGDEVELTNNNSLPASLGTIITFSQDEGTVTKYIKRENTTYTVDALSHSGIQTQVSNGNNFNTIKATVFDEAGNPPYLIQRSTTEFGSISKQTTELPISSGRKGVVVINGIEFVFYTGDIQVENQNIEFITLPDTFVVNSIETLNESMYSQPFELSTGSEILFSNFYYVINYDSTDSLLSANDQIHFNLELVKENTNEIVATYDDIVFTIQNLEKHENKNYLINCSNIEQGNYYFRLVTEVNGNASYFLSNIHNDQNLLAKRAYIREDLNIDLPPASFVLKQNYPNPFNPVTNIYFELPTPSKVSLIVYDIKGSVVSKLVNGQLNEGRYSIPFDGSNLASGLYFYVIDAKDYTTGNNFRQIKKMMLVK